MADESFSSTEFSEIQIMNEALDREGFRPLTSQRAILEYVNGSGWVKSPYFLAARVKRDDSGGSRPIYLGFNQKSAATDGDTDWIIFKFEWSSSKFVQSQMLVGTWTGRAALSWEF